PDSCCPAHRCGRLPNAPLRRSFGWSSCCSSSTPRRADLSASFLSHILLADPRPTSGSLFPAVKVVADAGARTFFVHRELEQVLERPLIGVYLLCVLDVSCA